MIVSVRKAKSYLLTISVILRAFVLPENGNKNSILINKLSKILLICFLVVIFNIEIC